MMTGLKSNYSRGSTAMGSKTLARALTVVMAVFLFTRAAVAADIRYDPNLYAPLAPADSDETITPGTRITLQNWQRYKRFMSVGLQVIYSGNYFWHGGSGPEYTLAVGPTIHIALPRQFLLDTEKFYGQTQLDKLRSGGYGLKGYVAGLPFPAPTAPELATKILYNARYVYYETVDRIAWKQFFIDRFLNVSPWTGESVVWRLSHLSSTGKAVNPPYSNGYLRAGRATVNLPEQFKYNTLLGIVPDDSSMPQEYWVFVPPLRRSLRLSTAARCATFLGTDFIYDEFAFHNSFLFALQISNYKATFLGERRILSLAHVSTDPAVRFNSDNVIIKGSLPGWPKPVLGSWELRNVYVVDISPLPGMAHKCYEHEVFYIDKESWLPNWVETYDASSRLWKTSLSGTTLVQVKDGEGGTIPFTNFGVCQRVGSPRPRHLVTDTSSRMKMHPDGISASLPAERLDATEQRSGTLRK
jgi:hypothetical protein